MAVTSNAHRIQVTASGGGGTPAFVSGLADFQVRNLTGTFAPTNGKETLHSVIPVAWQGGTQALVNGESAVIRAWSGGKGDTAGKRLFVRGGGHNNSGNNGLYYYDFNGASNPTGWVLVPNSLTTSPAGLSDNNSGVHYETYPDHKMTSVHSYDMGWYNAVLNRWYQFSGSAYASGSATNGVFYHDLTTKWSCDPTDAPINTTRVANRLGGTVFGKDDGSMFLWWGGNVNDSVGFWNSSGVQVGGFVGGSAASVIRNSNGATMSATRLQDDLNWLTTSTSGGNTYIYTHVVNWATPTVTSTLRLTNPGVLTGSQSTGGSLIYDSLLNVVWIFGCVRHCMTDPMSTEIVRLNMASMTLTTNALNYATSGLHPINITQASFGEQGSYNRHVWFPQWRIVGTVQSYVAPASIFKLPST